MKSRETPENLSVVEVKEVYKSFKTVKAVNGVSLTIKQGQFTALLGPNGAGKTTLVEMIEGIQKPDNGDITILGKKWEGHQNELHRSIGLSLQETRFIDKLTVEETMKLFAGFYQLGNERVNEIISEINLGEKRKSYTVNLSGGQRQKLALGLALLNNPKLLLLDEPTTGLDPNARREIWHILLQLKAKSQTSLILTTHYMEEAEQLCDYIIIIDSGRILLEGTRDELLNSDNKKIIEFTPEGSDNDLNEIISGNSDFDINWDENTRKGIITIDDLETELPEFINYLKLKNIQLKNFESRRKTLDDLFTTLTGRHLNA
ncbi:MAG TPA: ABC transporter ATP-binding protein [Ignavibacteriaceae bacterium]|jgi:ABC-2 type transport system ATP-binding protein|nr:ABC transporter ATP-binding protein [Ignavibacteriaceae bacterium]